VAWLLASLHLGPGCAGRAQGPPPARPNILFLVVDCLRADRVVPGHYPRRLTPAIAELGGEGTLFARAFSQAGWTRPSVASLLTGLYRA
jgi:arylsulfatase A-like enzyme